MYGFITEKSAMPLIGIADFFCYVRKISGLIIVLDSLSR